MFKFNGDSFEYYSKNYEVLFSYLQQKREGGYDIINIIDGNILSHPVFYISDSQERCRYCGKYSPEVSFKKKEHLFSESIGNKLFIGRKCECDQCNEFFGREYEKDLISFLYPYLVMNCITGKKGQRHYESFDKSSVVQYKDGTLTIKETMGAAKIVFDDKNKEIQYEFDIRPYKLINVYKALLKMALAILPENEFNNYKIMTKSLFEDNLQGLEIFHFNFYPGFNRFGLTTIGWKRIVDELSIPSYQFAIMNGDFLLQIPVFSDEDIRANNGHTISIEKLTTPTPFDHSDIGDVKSFTFAVKDTNITPAQKLPIKMKYEKIE